ncbi:MAG: lipopolysaccharide biosynthesis protein [Bacteroidaceae bacterium]|jgi:O-antigen/teichoic acid export membrane protein|nr:lipopolysaccharide biosynthesis protein [Bacteroidaceae bacterium]
MANLKSLAKDTAIYGLSSIVGRFINYLLVPIYTFSLPAASGGYGVITNVYAWTALAMVLLTFGMETTFFRFANKDGESPKKVYSTTLITVGGLSAMFVALVFAFIHPISSFLGYAEHPSWVWAMALTVAVDAFSCIPFCYLRYQKRPIKFATLKLLNILILITLNIIYFVGFKGKDPGFTFYINLIASTLLLLALGKEVMGIRSGFDGKLVRRMFSYSWPILVLGIAGILNQTADKIIFPFVYDGADAHAQLGIYGGASKIAMIMAMITQAFRYAYEPMVFSGAKDRNSKELYAKAMKFFLVFTLLAYLLVIGYIGLFKHIIARDYWEGLKVVPIVMAAEIMMGVYFNLSFWYKLIDKTIWGAIFSGIGCLALVLVNIIFVPKFGYMACAWGGFTGYGVAMVLSYFVGQKYNPVNYPLREMLVYVVLTAVLCVLMHYVNQSMGVVMATIINTLIIAVFVAYMVKKDFPLSSLPLVGKYFKKK